MNKGTIAPLSRGMRSIIPPIDPTRKTLTFQGLSDVKMTVYTGEIRVLQA